MLTVLFTLDYEIYGNGKGSLEELVLEPTRRLAALFQEFSAPFVVFAEALEFAKMEEAQSDPAIAEVRTQLRSLRAAGHEIGLHLHPWWANARRENGQWRLDWTERNICALPERRISQIVELAIAYLRDALGDPGFTPVSFRSGLWLMQPTQPMARVLNRHGVLIDSSVFKGGLTRELGLDYRPALKNGAAWRFSDDVNIPDSLGPMLELPIHTEMVPFWKMLGWKRLGLQRKVPAAANGTPLPNRWVDFARLRYPRKLDFCRMSYEEMQATVERALQADECAPAVLKLVVAIGHSKDLVDLQSIKRLLGYLERHLVPVATLQQAISTGCTRVPMPHRRGEPLA